MAETKRIEWFFAMDSEGYYGQGGVANCAVENYQEDIGSADELLQVVRVVIDVPVPVVLEARAVVVAPQAEATATASVE